MNGLGTRIKKIRRQKHVTQAELAKLLNVSESAISNYESETRTIHLDSLIKIADFFDVDINILIGRNRKIYSKTNGMKVSDEDIKFIKEIRKMECYKNVVANPEEFARIVDYETKDYDVEMDEGIPVQ